MWRAVLVLMLWPACGGAEDARSFDDLRAQISLLDRELAQLSGLLIASTELERADFPSTPLQRLSEIESELRRLTSNVERLEHRVERIVRDGTARVADLDRRLCQVEPGCDPRQHVAMATLGGTDDAPKAPVMLDGAQRVGSPGPKGLFDRAKDLFEAGDYAGAAQGFSDILSSRPSDSWAVSAEFWRGRSMEMLGKPQEAARAYLAAFSLDRSGSGAAEALSALGRVMGELGQTIEACVILGEVEQRFPASPKVQDARHLSQEYECP